MIWFTADTHFRHENIIRYCKRPFSSLDEMDETLLDNINANVRPDDTLYHLGDFSMRGRDAETIRSRIRCKNLVLVVGNHDPRRGDGTAKPQFAELFSAVYTLARIKVEIDRRSQLIVLCHYGMRVWDRSHYGAWHLYGHSHGTLPPIPGAMDVGVDCHDFRPIDIHEVAAKVKVGAAESTRELSR